MNMKDMDGWGRFRNQVDSDDHQVDIKRELGILQRVYQKADDRRRSKS